MSDTPQRLLDPRVEPMAPTKERMPWLVSMIYDAGLYTHALEVQRLGDALDGALTEIVRLSNRLTEVSPCGPNGKAWEKVWISQDVIMHLQGIEAQAGKLSDAINLFKRFESEARTDATPMPSKEKTDGL